jgi:hypothetical protein
MCETAKLHSIAADKLFFDNDKIAKIEALKSENHAILTKEMNECNVKYLSAKSELEKAEEPDGYSKQVWVSGGYMRLADALRTDHPSEAKKYLDMAKDIIDASPELIVRKKQFEKLSAKFV